MELHVFRPWLLALVASLGGSFADKASRRKVVVVGGGIGGGAFSHYWSKLHPTDELTVFESRDYIGGRLKHMTMHGQIVELGGDAWSTAVNEYIVELAKEFGSQRARLSLLNAYEKAPSLGDPMKSGMGVWQGQRIEPMVKLLLGQPISDLRAGVDEMEFIRKLRNNYHERGESGFFTSVDDFLSVASLNNYTEVSSKQYFSARSLMSSRHISQQLLDFALEPLTRVIYDQNLSESHAFSSLVAVTAAVGAASFDGGNSLLVERLFNSSGATVHLSTRVTHISFQESSRMYSLRSCTMDNKCSDQVAEVVILACPIEHANISFEPAVEVQPREWRHWYVTVTRARSLNPAFFGAPAGKPLEYDNVLTTENSSLTVPFNVLQLEARLSDGTALWKFFSNEDVSDKLPMIFEGWSPEPADTVVQHWPYTFPVLRPIKSGSSERYQPIILQPRLVYLNTMESVASAMEGSVIAARNAALLLHSETLTSEALVV